MATKRAAKKRPTGPSVSVKSFDQSRAHVTVNGQAKLDAESKDDSQLTVITSEIRRARAQNFTENYPKKQDVTPSIDWTKWGTIFAGLGILVAIAIAIFQ